MCDAFLSKASQDASLPPIAVEMRHRLGSNSVTLSENRDALMTHFLEMRHTTFLSDSNDLSERNDAMTYFSYIRPQRGKALIQCSARIGAQLPSNASLRHRTLGGAA